jgi:hypothetical protein
VSRRGALRALKEAARNLAHAESEAAYTIGPIVAGAELQQEMLELRVQVLTLRRRLLDSGS